MGRWTVLLTRDTTESVAVQIEAETSDEACAKALGLDVTGLEWTADDRAQPFDEEPYVTACDREEDGP